MLLFARIVWSISYSVPQIAVGLDYQQSIYSFRGVDVLFGVRRSLHFNRRYKFHAQDPGFQYF